MANTVIQIKRSTGSSAPTAGSLSAAEPAYSYLSEKLFIGSSDGSQVIEIGGRYYVNVAIQAYNMANTANVIAVAAFEAANNAITSSAGPAFDKANSANIIASQAFDKANSANLLAYNTGIGANAFAAATIAGANAYLISIIAGANTAVGAGANAYAATVGVGANNYADATFLPLAGGTIAGSLVVQGNATFSGTVTYANTQTLLIGDNILSLNADLPTSVAPSENAGIEVNRGSSTNTYLLWDEGIDKWKFTNDGTTYYNIPTNTDVSLASTIAVAAYDKANAANVLAYNTGIGANAFAAATIAGANAAVGAGANAFAAATIAGANSYLISIIAGANTAVGAGANAYADAVGSAANTNAANASYINTGTLAVSYGGTGRTTFANNGVLFGNTTSGIRVTAAGTEGNVLQVNTQGTPFFGMLDGGSF